VTNANRPALLRSCRSCGRNPTLSGGKRAFNFSIGQRGRFRRARFGAGGVFSAFFAPGQPQVFLVLCPVQGAPGLRFRAARRAIVVVGLVVCKRAAADESVGIPATWCGGAGRAATPSKRGPRRVTFFSSSFLPRLPKRPTGRRIFLIFTVFFASIFIRAGVVRCGALAKKTVSVTRNA